MLGSVSAQVSQHARSSVVNGSGTPPFRIIIIVSQNGGVRASPRGQRGWRVVTESDVASIASLMWTVPSLMPSFIAANT